MFGNFPIVLLLREDVVPRRRGVGGRLLHRKDAAEQGLSVGTGYSKIGGRVTKLWQVFTEQ